MNKRVAAAALVLLLGLAVPLLVPPVLWYSRYPDLYWGGPDVPIGGEVDTSRPFVAMGHWTQVEYWPVWYLGSEESDEVTIDKAGIYWPLVFTEQALILLLGGGLLTWVVRRERRRRAAPPISVSGDA